MEIQNHLEKTLTQEFSPVHMNVANESHMHSVPPNSETHFKVVLASKAFDNCRPVKRHQMVYKALSNLMSNPIHALSLHTYTVAEWHAQPQMQDSPNCMGGSRS